METYQILMAIGIGFGLAAGFIFFFLVPRK